MTPGIRNKAAANTRYVRVYSVLIKAKVRDGVYM